MWQNRSFSIVFWKYCNNILKAYTLLLNASRPPESHDLLSQSKVFWRSQTHIIIVLRVTLSYFIERPILKLWALKNMSTYWLSLPTAGPDGNNICTSNKFACIVSHNVFEFWKKRSSVMDKGSWNNISWILLFFLLGHLKDTS